MYHDKLRDLKTKRPKIDYPSPLDLSNHSNKSKNSFKEALSEHRNYTPTLNSASRPRTALQDQQGTSRVKVLLNNLVHNQDNQLFTQCLLSNGKKQKDSVSPLNKSGFQGKHQFHLNKTQKYTDNVLKKSEIQPNTNRESVKHQENSHQNNLYYMFQNKPSEPSLKSSHTPNKMLTLSQIARQYQQRNSNNVTPQRNQSPKQETYNNYLEQINQIKSKLDCSQISQQKSKQQQPTTPSNKTEKQQQFNQQLLLKNLTQQLAKQNTQTSTNQSNHSQSTDETIQQTITRLNLQKELLWNQMNLQMDKVSIQQLANTCAQIQKVLKEISDKQYSEYLYKINAHITDTLLLETYTILILTIEYIKQDQSVDTNLKNLIQYVTQSNLYILQVLHTSQPNDQIKQRVELRLTQNKKHQSKGRQTLQKNNYIIRSILELMQSKYQYEEHKRIDDTSRPESYKNIGFNQSSFDFFLIQSKKILLQIAKDLPKDSIESADTFLQSENKNVLPLKQTRAYTLVLDLDETLVHYQEFPNGGGQFLVRPYAEDFIEQLSKYYEIVIFTAAMQDYANFIIDIIDKKQVVAARLYRDQCICKDNIYIKDISILGRNIAKVIIVDNMPENFQLQPENGIYIQSWTGDQKDRALKDLQPLLEQIASKRVKDVRDALNQFREQMIERVQLGIKNPYQNLQLN